MKIAIWLGFVPILLGNAALGFAQAPIELMPVESPPAGIEEPAGSPNEEPVEAPVPGLPPLEKPALQEEPLISPAVIETSCRFTGTSAFVLSQGSNPLLDLKYKRCNLRIGLDGVVTATVDIQIALRLDADISHCKFFQVGLLFEGYSADDSLGWKGFRTLAADLPLENILGDKKDLGYFTLHSEPPDKPLTIKDLLFAPDAAPSFPELYWGTTTVLEEDENGPLASSVRRKTPVVHRLPASNATPDKPDVTIQLDIESYTPRGWCVYRDPTSQQDLIALLSVN